MKIAKTVFFICHIEIYYFCVQKVYNFKKKIQALDNKKNRARQAH